MAVSETLDRVRFIMTEEGPTPVFQGFHRGEHGMCGATVYVTLDTLRAMVKWHRKQSNAFDLIHNRMEPEENMLAFGGSVKDGHVVLTAPDGVTPLYMVCTYEPLIVQRFDPHGGKEYKIHGGDAIGIGHFGVWRNECAIDGEATPVGFVVDEQGWNDGRSDTPPFKTVEQERAEAAAKPYTDHDGYPTDDPRCELGLCVECLDDALASAGVEQRLVFRIPALSVADTRFGSDPAYRDKVIGAFKNAGITLREGEISR